MHHFGQTVSKRNLFIKLETQLTQLLHPTRQFKVSEPSISYAMSILPKLPLYPPPLCPPTLAPSLSPSPRDFFRDLCVPLLSCSRLLALKSPWVQSSSSPLPTPSRARPGGTCCERGMARVAHHDREMPYSRPVAGMGARYRRAKGGRLQRAMRTRHMKPVLDHELDSQITDNDMKLFTGELLRIKNSLVLKNRDREQRSKIIFV